MFEALLEEQLTSAIEIALHRAQTAECAQRGGAHAPLLVRPGEDGLAELDALRNRRRPVELNADEQVETLRLDAPVACSLRMLDRAPQRRLGFSDLTAQPRSPREQLPRPREQEIVIGRQRRDRMLGRNLQRLCVELGIRLQLRTQLDQDSARSQTAVAAAHGRERQRAYELADTCEVAGLPQGVGEIGEEIEPRRLLGGCDVGGPLQQTD